MKYIVETINDLGKGEDFTVKALNNLTNGEVIKALFPSAKIKKVLGVEYGSHIEFTHNNWDFEFSEEWWNSLYKEE